MPLPPLPVAQPKAKCWLSDAFSHIRCLDFIPVLLLLNSLHGNTQTSALRVGDCHDITFFTLHCRLICGNFDRIRSILYPLTPISRAFPRALALAPTFPPHQLHIPIVAYALVQYTWLKRWSNPALNCPQQGRHGVVCRAGRGFEPSLLVCKPPCPSNFRSPGLNIYIISHLACKYICDLF